MKPNDEIVQILAINAAQVRAVVELLEAAMAELGHPTIEGVSVPEWFRNRLNQELSEVLISMEDIDPAVAARLQQRIDMISKKPPDT